MNNTTSIKNSNVVNSIRNIRSAGWKQIRKEWTAEWNLPYQDEMQKGYEIALARTKRLHDASNNGNIAATRAIEAFMHRTEKFMDPSAHVTDPLDRKMAAEMRKVVNSVGNGAGIPEHMAAEYVHTMNSFPTLTQACARRALARMFDPEACDDNCFSDIFYNAPAREYCDDSGLVGIVPVNSGNGAGCAHGEGCDCTPNYWQFGEVKRGYDVSKIMTDAIMWSWDLGQCTQYGGLDDIFFESLISIINKRKQALDVSMFFKDGELNPLVFNNDHQNIIASTDGTCNPAVSCAADAKYLLESIAKQWNYHTDLQGNRVCNRRLKLITADFDVKCAFDTALAATTTERKELVAGDPGAECATEIEITAPGCFPDIEICYSNVMRDALGDENAKGKFIIAPVSGRTASDQNVARRYTIQGFEGIELVQKVPMWQSLGGRPLQRYGMNYCWDQEFMAISSHGMGFDYPEFVFASDGTGVCPAGYTSNFGEALIAGTI